MSSGSIDLQPILRRLRSMRAMWPPSRWSTRPAAREGKRRIPQQSLSIRRSRFIYGGLHERIGIQNCGTEPVEIECSLRIEGDFSRHVRRSRVQGGEPRHDTSRLVEKGSGAGACLHLRRQDGLMRRTRLATLYPRTSTCREKSPRSSGSIRSRRVSVPQF